MASKKLEEAFKSEGCVTRLVHLVSVALLTTVAHVDNSPTHHPRKAAMWLRVLIFLPILLMLQSRSAIAQTTAGSAGSPPPAGAPVAPAPTPTVPPCVPVAPDGYTGKACVVTIDRDNPASPAAMVVRGQTSITIRVKNARWNETVIFTIANSKVAAVDVAGTFFKNAISPLQALVLAQRAHSGPFITVNDPIGTAQTRILNKLNDVLAKLANATVALTCLETYKVLDTTNPQYACDPHAKLDAGSFPAAKANALKLMQDAAVMPLPVAEWKAVDANVNKEVNASIALPETNAAEIAAKNAALDKDDKYATNQVVLNSVISDAESSQKAMMETAQQIINLAGSSAEATYTIQQPHNYNSIVTVAAQEVVSKTSTALGTVTISWQSNPWEISTGILFSTLVARSFTNAPLIVNGKPVLDPSGKTLTVVTESDTRPVVVLPLVMANFRLRGLSHYPWENRCPNHCAFLLSGGVGLNLTTKTADFAVGPSFQIGEVLITTAAHFGRESMLTNGVTVGSQLGSSPPNPLPTANKWVTGFGIAISYVLPFQ